MYWWSPFVEWPIKDVLHLYGNILAMSGDDTKLVGHIVCPYIILLLRNSMLTSKFYLKIGTSKTVVLWTKSSLRKERLQWISEGCRKIHRLHKPVPEAQKEVNTEAFIFMNFIMSSSYSRKTITQLLYCIIWASFNNLCLGQMPWTWIKKKSMIINLSVLRESIWQLFCS